LKELNSGFCVLSAESVLIEMILSGQAQVALDTINGIRAKSAESAVYFKITLIS
jgi:hypothetical protein